MKKIVLLFIVVVSWSIKLWAIPACSTPVNSMQPDGAEVIYYIKGDEKIHWKESPAGYTLMYNSNKYLVFAEKDMKGGLKASDVIYRGDDLSNYFTKEEQQIVQTSKNLFYSEEQIALLKQIWAISDEMNAPDRAVSPVTGEKHVLVLLGAFSDKEFIHTTEEFEAMFNQDDYNFNGNKGSVRDFYRVNSYGQVDFHVTVAGPYTPNATYTMVYAANHSSQYAKEIARLADTDVDYSTFASGAYVPSFHIIFAGHGDESIDNGEQIWSHASSFSSYLAADGVYVGQRYSCSPELAGAGGTTISSIGVVCHELCHTFGAPDYYDTDYAGSGGEYPGAGDWDLMASGAHNNSGKCPAGINMWQKIIFGWVNPVELTEPMSITSMPNSNDSAVAYWVKVGAGNNGERYVLENRQKTGFDSYVPGHGLLIWHIHDLAKNGNCSNRTHPQQVYPICRNSNIAIPNSSVSSYGNINDSRCPFPGPGKTEFSATSIPAMFSWNGSSGDLVNGKAITNIAETTGNNKLISFDFMGGNVAYLENINDNGFSIYPNPAGNFANIYSEKLTTVNVYDIAGKKIDTFTIAAGDIYQCKYQSGIYFFENAGKIQKIIFE